ncbi:phosphatase PAP2 family protein [bacterium]|nr:phosphatase PAP2 family protein [bacterium]
MKRQNMRRAFELFCGFLFACLLTILFCAVAALPAYSEESAQAHENVAKDFVKDLGKNSMRLFSTRNATPFVVGVSASGLSRLADRSVSEFFENGNRLGNSEEVGTFLGLDIFLASGTAALFVGGRLSDDAKFREMSYSMTQGMILNTIVTVGIKESVNRIRPNRLDGNSFISGHASSMFTIATVLDEFYGHKVGVSAYAIAIFVGITRLSKNVHYLSDVVAGAAVGYIVGRTVSSGNSFSERQFTWTPAFSPHGDGLGLALTIRF